MLSCEMNRKFTYNYQGNDQGDERGQDGDCVNPANPDARLIVPVDANGTPSETRSEVAEEPGRSKRKRVARQVADVLNGCLCGSVLDGSMSSVLKCKQAGCETQWVSTALWVLIHL